MNPELGRRAVDEAKKKFAKQLLADMVFIACGAGGGTGSGAAPRIAQISKNRALTVAVITKLFSLKVYNACVLPNKQSRNSEVLLMQ